jgi:hypothetical protein
MLRIGHRDTRDSRVLAGIIFVQLLWWLGAVITCSSIMHANGSATANAA